MIRTIHYLSLIGLAITIIAFIVPRITGKGWLFVAFAASLITAFITRLALDSKEQKP